jgi:hypothetical protein
MGRQLDRKSTSSVTLSPKVTTAISPAKTTSQSGTAILVMEELSPAI